MSPLAHRQQLLVSSAVKDKFMMCNADACNTDFWRWAYFRRIRTAIDRGAWPLRQMAYSLVGSILMFEVDHFGRRQSPSCAILAHS